MNLFFSKTLTNHSPRSNCLGLKPISSIAGLVTPTKVELPNDNNKKSPDEFGFLFLILKNEECWLFLVIYMQMIRWAR